MRFAVAVRPDREQAILAASRAASRLRESGHDVVEVRLDSPRLAAEASGVEIACVFGGDGTMLRATRAFAPLGPALIGINLGRLGFLTGTAVEDFDAVVRDIAAGRYQVEERSLLAARVERDGREILSVNALNDVVVARGTAVRSIHVDVRIDDEPFTVYWADGLIVATATGSTAYAFAVGGPIVLPTSHELLMVPIAPHLSFRNAVVLDPDERVELRAMDPARLSIDGQEEHDLLVGDRLLVRRSDVVARFVRTPGMQPFLALLKAKILKEGGTV